jgi:hypothetical protein
VTVELSLHPESAPRNFALGTFQRGLSMTLYGVLMLAIIVVVDFAFFKSKEWFWERLMANVGIVLMFAAFYFRFLKRS